MKPKTTTERSLSLENTQGAPVENSGGAAPQGRLDASVVSILDETIESNVHLLPDTEGYKLRLKRIFENVKDIIGLHNAQGKYLMISPSVETITGFAMSELIGKSPCDFWHVEDKQRLGSTQLVDVFRSSAFDKVIEYRHLHKKGHYIWLQSQVIKRNDGPVSFFTTSTRDVTDSYRVRAQLNESVEALKRSNEELQTFAYVASHDLQEPLRVITSYLQLLHRKYSEQLDDRAYTYISRTMQAAGRMKTLISDLLALSRVDSRDLNREVFDPVIIIQEILLDMQLMINDHKAMIYYQSLPMVYGDRVQLRQLFQNLISNAIRFHREAELPRIQISGERQGTHVEIRIKDNGIGIREQDFERAFAIFQRLNSRSTHPGNGMGLAICRKIVERHGGNIWLESEVDKGTTAIFTLPECNS